MFTCAQSNTLTKTFTCGQSNTFLGNTSKTTSLLASQFVHRARIMCRINPSRPGNSFVPDASHPAKPRLCCWRELCCWRQKPQAERLQQEPLAAELGCDQHIAWCGTPDRSDSSACEAPPRAGHTMLSRRDDAPMPEAFHVSRAIGSAALPERPPLALAAVPCTHACARVDTVDSSASAQHCKGCDRCQKRHRPFLTFEPKLLQM